MATTIVPDYSVFPIDPNLDVEKLRRDAYEALQAAQGDEDKAGDPYDASFYEGNVTALTWLLNRLTTSTPVLAWVEGYATPFDSSEAEAQTAAPYSKTIYFFDE